MTEEKFRELDDLYREIMSLKSHKRNLTVNNSDNPELKYSHPFDEVVGGGQTISVNKFYSTQLHILKSGFLPISIRVLVDQYVYNLDVKIKELEEKFNNFKP